MLDREPVMLQLAEKMLPAVRPTNVVRLVWFRETQQRAEYIRSLKNFPSLSKRSRYMYIISCEKCGRNDLRWMGREVEMRCMVRVESKLNGETDRQKHRGERQRIE